ncbi:hypothetical protein AAMO2058_000444000 [Amorphochlora amoebiformis]
MEIEESSETLAQPRADPKGSAGSQESRRSRKIAHKSPIVEAKLMETPSFDFRSNPPTWYESIVNDRLGFVGPSGFGSASTASAVAQKFSSVAKGKTILITGCTMGGLGFETARILAGLGAKVVLNTRNKEKGEKAMDAIKAEFKSADVSLVVFDLGKLSTIQNKALGLFEEAVGKGAPLHILLNNAGIMACPFTLTEQKIETQFGVNHIGHFALFKELIPALKKGAADGYCRVVNLSSMGHRILANLDKKTIFDPEHFNDEKKYHVWDAYGRSKFANVVFASEIEKRYGDQGIHAYSLHPGAILTNLGRHIIPQWIENSWLMRKFFGLVWNMKNIPQGSATSVYAALAPDIQNGGYFDNCNLGKAHLWCFDEDLGKTLWEVSEKLTG